MMEDNGFLGGFVDVLLLVPAKNKAAIGKGGCAHEHKASCKQQQNWPSENQILNSHSPSSGFHRPRVRPRDKKGHSNVSLPGTHAKSTRACRPGFARTRDGRSGWCRG